MTAFRLFSRLNTFYGMTGQLLAAGQLKFYDAGTTTPRPVYGDSGLAVNNGVAVRLDSSGRPDVDIWGKGPISSNSLTASVQNRVRLTAYPSLAAEA